MKNVKRLSAWILALVLCVSVLVLVACVDNPEAQELAVTLPKLEENQMVIVIKNSDKDFTTIPVTLGSNGVDAKTVADVLEYLNEEGTLITEWTESTYGKFITRLGSIQPATSSEWVAVFTSNASEQDTSAYATTYKIGDVTITTSIVGVSELSVFAGCIIYFELGSM